MQQVKYLILGAGPAGLSFALRLKEKGENSFLVLEKEKIAGGLCRSEIVDGSPFDIGGGHFLDVRRPQVKEFLFSFMPETEWNLFERDSRIQLKGKLIHHPIEANIWEMELQEQVDYLMSISKAGCNVGKEMPSRFVDWIRWKLGDKVADEYMLPYNQKMFADQLNELGTYWLDKLPNVSFEETLLSCLTNKPYGTQPGHAQFYYPKEYGYGEVWLRMAETIKEHILYEQNVVQLDIDKKEILTQSGEQYLAQNIVTTIPWMTFQQIKGMPEKMVNSIQKLKVSAIETRYVEKELDTKAQWIYYPESELPYHRILVRHNFCNHSKGYWYETRKERTAMFEKTDSYCYMNEFAYPLNTIDKPEIMNDLLKYCRERRVFGLGRWGEHSHFNSDVTVERALDIAEEIG